MPSTLVLRRPFDAHLHLRDGEVLQAVLGETSRDFAQAIVMPNLVPPIVTWRQAEEYRARIAEAVPRGDHFKPLMTLYLTEQTDPYDVEADHASGLVKAVKLYPAGATTNSSSGVRHLENAMPVLERMADLGLPLCIHGEVTLSDVDIFDREAAFVEAVLDPLRGRLPDLKVTMEHVTTAECVDYIKEAPANLAGSITPHHLIINRNAMLAGGIKPHYYCLPVAKREHHRLALRAAATSGGSRFFLGTDSAPHVDAMKECACGCAGIFNATNALSCLAHVFEQENALDKLEAFTSLHAPAWYGVPPAKETVVMRRQVDPICVPDKIETGEGPVTLFDPMFPLHWAVQR
ncbi:dihydroorotase [Sinorhizobium meliloti]|uniref:dihydroorotase n=1 Tax=Rhizobium meliloti TaxID=382 RepID=UPI00299CDC6A|nr:dihydroorotase [Sinorhizobium meliloti]MDW9870752.1 dihydroorotase [Sinorhizobium meliloti]MDW9883394.1 dihydroorotase [Sinorhizobium meliloti]MDX0205082.1 dihydroorotase [Sinorhizobium meliloti]